MRAAVLCVLLASIGAAQELPEWLKFGGNYRARGEFTRSADFEAGEDQNYYLGRLRLNADIKPRPSFEMFIEGQDCRVGGLSDADADGLRNMADLRQAWVRLGAENSPWQMQLGRQSLAFGDERLIGADDFLDPLGFTWDAAQITYKRGGLQLKSFAAWHVSSNPRSMDRSDSHERLYGVDVTLPEVRKGLQIEPYFFYNEQLRHWNESGPFTNRIGVLGFRSVGTVGSRFDYNVEMATERGRYNDGSMRSWAGHWEGGWRIGMGDRAPQLRAEYNLATGDRDPNDRVHGTFNDLYPAGYNAYGMADPFAWRNIRNPSTRLVVPLKRNVTVLGGWRWYSLDSIHDGLYTVGEDCLVRARNATSGNVGQQVSLGAFWEPSSLWKVSAGYAEFFSGTYLREAGLHNRMATPYVSLAFFF